MCKCTANRSQPYILHLPKEKKHFERGSVNCELCSSVNHKRTTRIFISKFNCNRDQRYTQCWPAPFHTRIHHRRARAWSRGAGCHPFRSEYGTCHSSHGASSSSAPPPSLQYITDQLYGFALTLFTPSCVRCFVWFSWCVPSQERWHVCMRWIFLCNPPKTQNEKEKEKKKNGVPLQQIFIQQVNSAVDGKPLRHIATLLRLGSHHRRLYQHCDARAKQ